MELLLENKKTPGPKDTGVHSIIIYAIKRKYTPSD